MLSHDIGIDLGTSNTLIYEQNKGIILNKFSNINTPSILKYLLKSAITLPINKNIVASFLDEYEIFS